MIPIKEEALENALLNLRRFYKWSIKDGNEAHRQIAALQEELTNAANVQAKVAVISDHLTLASQSFTGIEGLYTVFENHRKSLIQHCEQSYVYILSRQK